MSILCTLDLAADQHVLKHSSRSCKTKYIRVQYAALWVRPWPIAMFACITSVLSKEAFYTADMIIIIKDVAFCGSGGGQKVSTMCSYVTFTSPANLCVHAAYSPYMVYSLQGLLFIRYKKHMRKSFPIIWVGTINFYILHAYYSFFNARYKAMTQSKTR